MKQFFTSSLATTSALSLALCAPAGAVVSAVSSNAIGQSWNTPATWSDGLAAHSGDDYEIGGGFEVRTPDASSGAGTVFPGDSLTLLPTGQLTLKNSGSGATSSKTFSDLRMAGGRIVHGGGVNSNITLDGNISFTTSTISNFTMNGTNGRNYTLGALLSGDGTLRMSGSDGRSLTVTNPGNTFNGLFDVTTSTLNFDYNYASGGMLALSGNGDLLLDQDLTFTGLSIGGDNIGAGVYTTGTLTAINASYAGFFDGGSSATNTITVIPEPSAALLSGFAALALLRRRRG